MKRKSSFLLRKRNYLVRIAFANRAGVEKHAEYKETD
jgi:hypothetical protein